MRRRYDLVLIGTVHRDPRGEGALLEVLEEERPEIVTVEVSLYSLRFRQRHRELLAKPDLPAEVREFLRLPFEYRAAKRYGTRHRVPVLPLDLCLTSRKYLHRAGELLKGKSILSTREPPLEEALAREYALAKRCWSDPKLAKAILKGRDLRRERALAKRILQILRHHPNKKVVHVGGWTHMLQIPGSMYQLISDLNPRRKLLEPAACRQGIDIP